MNIFLSYLFSAPTYFLLVTLSVIPSICLHEYFHAQTALWMGDDTAAYHGHLTLNPLRQMGWMSILTFLIIGIAWGMVPVNRGRLSRKGAVLVSLSGPLTNLALFVLATAGLVLMLFLKKGGTVFPELLYSYCLFLAVYNLVLFFINMLPVPGLDGWGVLSEFFTFRNINSEFVKGGMLLFMLAVFVSVQYIFQAAFWIVFRILKLAAP